MCSKTFILESVKTTISQTLLYVFNFNIPQYLLVDNKITFLIDKLFKLKVTTAFVLLLVCIHAIFNEETNFIRSNNKTVFPKSMQIAN